jgi:hypothetical protein
MKHPLGAVHQEPTGRCTMLAVADVYAAYADRSHSPLFSLGGSGRVETVTYVG